MISAVRLPRFTPFFLFTQPPNNFLGAGDLYHFEIYFVYKA